MADPEVLLAAYDSQMRMAEAAHLAPGVSTRRDGPIMRIVGQHRGFISSPSDLGLEEDELDALIARQRDFFAARGEAVEWKTRGYDRPANIVPRLLAAGFVAKERETVMIGVAADRARPPAPVPSGLALRQTRDDGDMGRIAAMESEVWGHDMDWMAADLIGRVQSDPDQIAVFVAEAGDQVVAAAWLVLRPGTEFAGLWGGSTRAAWRGRGLYRALVARRAQRAVERGVRLLQVDASDDSRPILERLGFVAVTSTTPYVWTPA
jgi:GNAT superfamily N-acetyltransferase